MDFLLSWSPLTELLSNLIFPNNFIWQADTLKKMKPESIQKEQGKPETYWKSRLPRATGFLQVPWASPCNPHF